MERSKVTMQDVYDKFTVQQKTFVQLIIGTVLENNQYSNKEFTDQERKVILFMIDQAIQTKKRS